MCVGADFGFRHDSSALVVVHRVDGLYIVAEFLRGFPCGSPLPAAASCVISRFQRWGWSPLVAPLSMKEDRLAAVVRVTLPVVEAARESLVIGKAA
jgi:hypothetical protein